MLKVIFLLSLFYIPSQAQTPSNARIKNVQNTFSLNSVDQKIQKSLNTDGFVVQLISPYSHIKKGETSKLGIKIQFPLDWYSYWSFAGDFGKSPIIKWKAIPHVRIKSLPFPTPKRKALSINKKLVYNFIYEKEMLIPFEIFIDPKYPSKVLNLSVHITWFACKKICISKESQLNLSLKVFDTLKINKISQKVFLKWDKFFPVHQDIKSDFTVQNNLMIVNFSFNKPIRCLDIFPSHLEDFSTDIPRLLHQTDQSCSFSIKKTFSHLPKVFGLLVYSQDNQNKSSLFESYKESKFSLLWFILMAFLGGLILNIMPCVLPILFLKFYNTMQLKNKSKKKILIHNLSYALGIIVSFLALAFILLLSKQAGENLGWGFHLQAPLFVLCLAILFFVMACFLLGILPLSSPKISFFFKKDQVLSHFFTGILSTTAASPCTVPFMASAVGFALSRSSVEIFIIFFFLGFGLSFPYFLISIFPKILKYIPSPGAWSEILKKAFSIPLFLTAVWLFWVLYFQVHIKVFLFSTSIFFLILIQIFVYKNISKSVLKNTLHVVFLCLYILFFIKQNNLRLTTQAQHSIKPMRNIFFENANWSIFETNKLEQDKQSGKNILVVLGAEWCLSCKTNERIFETQDFKNLIKKQNIVLYYGDWTLKNSEITDFLSNYMRQGVPFYIFFKANEKTFIFPTLLFKQSFLKKLKELSN